MLQTADIVEIIVVANCTLSSPHFPEPLIIKFLLTLMLLLVLFFT